MKEIGPGRNTECETVVSPKEFLDGVYNFTVNSIQEKNRYVIMPKLFSEQTVLRQLHTPLRLENGAIYRGGRKLDYGLVRGANLAPGEREVQVWIGKMPSNIRQKLDLSYLQEIVNQPVETGNAIVFKQRSDLIAVECSIKYGQQFDKILAECERNGFLAWKAYQESIAITAQILGF